MRKKIIMLALLIIIMVLCEESHYSCINKRVNSQEYMASKDEEYDYEIEIIYNISSPTYNHGKAYYSNAEIKKYTVNYSLGSDNVKEVKDKNGNITHLYVKNKNKAFSGGSAGIQISTSNGFIVGETTDSCGEWNRSLLNGCRTYQYSRNTVPIGSHLIIQFSLLSENPGVADNNTNEDNTTNIYTGTSSGYASSYNSIYINTVTGESERTNVQDGVSGSYYESSTISFTTNAKVGNYPVGVTNIAWQMVIDALYEFKDLIRIISNVLLGFAILTSVLIFMINVLQLGMAPTHPMQRRKLFIDLSCSVICIAMLGSIKLFTVLAIQIVC